MVFFEETVNKMADNDKSHKEVKKRCPSMNQINFCSNNSCDRSKDETRTDFSTLRSRNDRYLVSGQPLIRIDSF